MFEEHPSLTLPPNEQKLFRYLDFTKFVSLLMSRSLYLASLRSYSMSDPFEGVFPDIDVSNLAVSGFPAGMLDAVKANRDRSILYRNIWAVSCWSMNKSESYLMWKSYLKNQDEGLAIQTTFHNLRNVLHEFQKPVYGGIVEYYSTQEVKAIAGRMIYGASLKRKEFEDEREFRIIIFNPPGNLSEKELQEHKPSDTIPVDLNQLIESVILSPTSTTMFKGIVENLMVKYDLDPSIVVESSLKIT
jgi:hypothetical protein